MVDETHVEIAKKVAHKKKLKKKLGKQCVYCNCNNPLLLTIDHILPLGRGGADDDKNKQVACVICNKLKGALTDSEFKRYMKALSTLHDLAKVKFGNMPTHFALEFNQMYYPEFGLKPKTPEKKV